MAQCSQCDRQFKRQSKLHWVVNEHYQNMGQMHTSCFEKWARMELSCRKRYAHYSEDSFEKARRTCWAEHSDLSLDKRFLFYCCSEAEVEQTLAWWRDGPRHFTQEQCDAARLAYQAVEQAYAAQFGMKRETLPR